MTSSIVTLQSCSFWKCILPMLHMIIAKPSFLESCRYLDESLEICAFALPPFLLFSAKISVHWCFPTSVIPAAVNGNRVANCSDFSRDLGGSSSCPEWIALREEREIHCRWTAGKPKQRNQRKLLKARVQKLLPWWALGGLLAAIPALKGVRIDCHLGSLQLYNSSTFPYTCAWTHTSSH